MAARKKAASRSKRSSPTTQPPSPIALRLAEWKFFALIAIITFISFAPVLNAQFTTWDDNETIAQNWAINPPSLAGLAFHWSHPSMDLYVPITYSAWWITSAISNANPVAFHLLNLLLHIVGAILVYRILRLLIDRPWPAFAGAMLFAVHPLQVEPVAWASGTKDVLGGVLALYVVLKYLVFCQSRNSDEPKSVHRRRVAYFVALIAFILALLSKPSTMVVPAMLLVIDWLIFARPIGQVIAAVAPFFAFAMPFMIAARLIQPAPGTPRVSLATQPLVAADAISFYLYKLSLPIRLCVEYGRNPQRVIDAGWIRWTWLAPAGVVLVLAIFRRYPVLIAGAMIFVIGVAPVLGLVPFDFQAASTVADHYLYLSMLGAALVVGDVLRRADAKLATPICATLLIALAARSFDQARYWHDSMTLFDRVLAINPDSSFAHNSIAIEYNKLQKFDLAIEHAKRAIALTPDDPKPYGTLAATFALTGDLLNAEKFLRAGLALAPNEPRIMVPLAGIIAQLGKEAEAMDLCRRSLAIDPNNVDAHQNLGVLYVRQNRLTEARDQFAAAVELRPENPMAQVSLAVVLASTGDTAAATRHYRAALAIDPNFPPAIQGLADLQNQRPNPQ